MLKTLEKFDTTAAGDLDIRLIRDLSGCDYIKERRNVLFLGRSGVGKTHLATALGVAACKNNYRTRFVFIGHMEQGLSLNDPLSPSTTSNARGDQFSVSTGGQF